MAPIAYKPEPSFPVGGSDLSHVHLLRSTRLRLLSDLQYATTTSMLAANVVPTDHLSLSQFHVPIAPNLCDCAVIDNNDDFDFVLGTMQSSLYEHL